MKKITGHNHLLVMRDEHNVSIIDTISNRSHSLIRNEFNQFNINSMSVDINKETGGLEITLIKSTGKGSKILRFAFGEIY